MNNGPWYWFLAPIIFKMTILQIKYPLHYYVACIISYCPDKEFFLLWSTRRLLPSGTFPTLMWSDASCLGLLQHSPFFLPRPHSTIGRRLERFNMGERYLSEPFTKFIIIPSVQLHGENIRKKWRRWRRRRRRQQGREEGEGRKEQEQVQEEGAQLEVSSGKIQATYFWKVSPCSPNIYSQAEQDESNTFLRICFNRRSVYSISIFLVEISEVSPRRRGTMRGGGEKASSIKTSRSSSKATSTSTWWCWTGEGGFTMNSMTSMASL